MAKKNEKAIYAPGELGRVRQKLGVTDAAEAKRMAQLLGGEVGTERSVTPDAGKDKKAIRRETVDVTIPGKSKKIPGRRIDISDEFDELDDKPKSKTQNYPDDDPSIELKTSYKERVKMDQYAGQLVFEIKNSAQVFTSVISLFKEPVDYVNPRFVTKRMNEYYAKIEKLVKSAMNLFPKSNFKRNNQLKRVSPFVYNMLVTIRDWNIEEIAKLISQIQSRPRDVLVSDFADILKDIYKPLYILSDLNSEDIKTAFKLIYKILYIESPMNAKEKYQDVIRNVILSLSDVRRDVQFGMYPLLMKLISCRFIQYDRFFIERQRRFINFLGLTGSEVLKADDLSAQRLDSMEIETIQKDLKDSDVEELEEVDETEKAAEADLSDPKVVEQIKKEETENAEQKSLDQGRSAMNVLFPKAGWEKLEEFPDLYPYFASTYNLKNGVELIAPTDPLQQVFILMIILDDFFKGLRYAVFGKTNNENGSFIKEEELTDMINNWQVIVDSSFIKEYLPRLTEYCRIIDNSSDARTSIYARRNMNEMQWMKRLYFLPYYKFESIGPPPFQKDNITSVYTMIRKLRRYFAEIGKNIEQGLFSGGAQVKAVCEGITNPWQPYIFQVPNPISRRLDMLLSPPKRTNATLILFALSAITVLDYIVNNENSWSYSKRSGPLFRSIRDEGILPIFGVDKKLDAEQMFKDSLRKK